LIDSEYYRKEGNGMSMDYTQEKTSEKSLLFSQRFVFKKRVLFFKKRFSEDPTEKRKEQLVVANSKPFIHSSFEQVFCDYISFNFGI
jgi:hypothetical protein